MTKGFLNNNPLGEWYHPDRDAYRGGYSPYDVRGVASRGGQLPTGAFPSTMGQPTTKQEEDFILNFMQTKGRAIFHA